MADWGVIFWWVLQTDVGPCSSQCMPWRPDRVWGLLLDSLQLYYLNKIEKSKKIMLRDSHAGDAGYRASLHVMVEWMLGIARSTWIARIFAISYVLATRSGIFRNVLITSDCCWRRIKALAFPCYGFFWVVPWDHWSSAPSVVASSSVPFKQAQITQEIAWVLNNPDCFFLCLLPAEAHLSSHDGADSQAYRSAIHLLPMIFAA